MIDYFLMPHPPIIIPEVGKGAEKEVSKTIESCRKVGDIIEESDAETIVIITPHGPVFRDAVAMINTDTISGDFSNFEAPEVTLIYDIDLALTKEIIEITSDNKIAVASIDEKTSKLYNVELNLDHGAMVPLYYADKKRNHKLVHITYGMLSPIELLKFGTSIRAAIEKLDKKVAVIASGDLSHTLIENGPYPYNPHGREFDNLLIKILSEGRMKDIFDINKKLSTEAGQCGLRSLYILAGIINTSTVNSKFFSYEGNFGVGYSIFQFSEGNGDLFDELMEERKNTHNERLKGGNIYTSLARLNLDRYFTNGTIVDIAEIKNEQLLNDKKGVFVSLKINGELRGCIGTIYPVTSCVGEEIIRNSLSAALDDPRFHPLTEEELQQVDISVDLLYPPEETTFDKLDPSKYGVIVTSGNKKGLLLPNLEGIDTKEKQVEIAISKGNILPNEEYTLERFKVERFSEVEDD